MNDAIIITNLNDFTFCPVSIYFHNLYGSPANILYQSKAQINGTNAHKTVDNNSYSMRKEILTGLDVYSEKYNLTGKIDIYNQKTKELIERKKHVVTVYEGYIFQLYAQYYCMLEMGYEIAALKIHSMDDNKTYTVDLPSEDINMNEKFEKLINDIEDFSLEEYVQTNEKKCKTCIYESLCDRSLIGETNA